MKIGSVMKWGFRRPLLLLVLLLTVLVFTGCRTGLGAIPKGWSGAVTDNGTLYVGTMDGRVAAVDIEAGRQIWDVPLETEQPSGGGFGCTPVATSPAIYGTPALAEELVYVGSYIPVNRAHGRIYAFTLGRDEPKWVYPRQGSLDGPIIGGIVSEQGKVYFGTDSANGVVYALNAADGFKEWEFSTGDKIWSTPAVEGDTLYIGSFDNKLYAIDINNGSKKWEFETEGAIASTPVVSGNTVYIGSFDRNFYALNTADGSLKWTFLAENWFWAKPVIHNGYIYAANLDGKVYVLDAGSGNKQLEFDLGKPIASSPVLVGDNLLVVATDIDSDKNDKSIIYILDTTNNRKDELALLEEEVQAPLTASQGKIYIHTEADSLYEIDVQSGAEREFNIKKKGE